MTLTEDIKALGQLLHADLDTRTVFLLLVVSDETGELHAIGNCADPGEFVRSMAIGMTIANPELESVPTKKGNA